MEDLISPTYAERMLIRQVGLRTLQIGEETLGVRHLDYHMETGSLGDYKHYTTSRTFSSCFSE
jgi:hypothetical protein